MTVLTELLEKTDYKIICGNADIKINNLVMDSRKVSDGDMFICIKGASFDGHKFIENVCRQGVKVIVVEQDIEDIIEKNKELFRNVTVVKVEDTKLAQAKISAAYFGYPAKRLKTIGITGTKGKTTTSYMVYEALNKAGIKTGLIGTIETIFKDKKVPSVNTTPDSFTLQKTFKEMADEGIEAVVLEVSSQGLMLKRVAGFTFDYGVFTNLGKDHIGENEHKDFEDYKYCKSLLFKQCKCGIINMDDKYAQDMIKDNTCDVIETFGIKDNNKKDAPILSAEEVKLFNEGSVLGIEFVLNVKNEKKYDFKVNMPGIFNVYNSLTAIAITRHFVDDMTLTEKALRDVRVKGRAEIVKASDDFTVMIDYAHNAMSLESLLKSLKEYAPKRIVTVFGCGGNRDKNRRYEMGEVSSNMADFTIITSDNPRHEKPAAIMEDIVSGVKKGPGEYITIEDRQEAVYYAIKNGKAGDIIVIAGKGHEDYQIIGDVKYHMDDRELVENARIKLKEE